VQLLALAGGLSPGVWLLMHGPSSIISIIGGSCLAAGCLASLAELSPSTKPLPSLAVILFVVGVTYHWIRLRRLSPESATVADQMAFWVGFALVIGAM
jgi:hypothetical protein